MKQINRTIRKNLLRKSDAPKRKGKRWAVRAERRISRMLSEKGEA